MCSRPCLVQSHVKCLRRLCTRYKTLVGGVSLSGTTRPAHVEMLVVRATS